MGNLKWLAVALALAGCTGSLAEIHQQGQDTADRARNVALADDCAITVGSYFRLPKLQQQAVQILCGGDAVDELRAVMSR